MVDRGAAIDNKISGLKVLYQALNKNITLISDQLKRPQEHTISNSSQNGQWKNTGYQNRKH